MNIYIYFSTFLIPIFSIIYIMFPSIRSVIFLHNCMIAIVGGIDAYFRQMNNRQPIQQIRIFNLSVGESSVVSLFIHLVLVAVLIYRPIDPLEISTSSHFLLILLTIVVFGVPHWPYSITRTELFLVYILGYFIFFAESIILNKKMIRDIEL